MVSTSSVTLQGYRRMPERRFDDAVHSGPSRTRDAAMGEILLNRGDTGARLTAPESCQALRDARDSVGVPKDFQGHLQALKVVHRQQDNLRLSVAGQDDPLMVLVHSPGQLRKAGLGFGQRHRRRECPLIWVHAGGSVAPVSAPARSAEVTARRSASALNPWLRSR